MICIDFCCQSVPGGEVVRSVQSRSPGRVVFPEGLGQPFAAKRLEQVPLVVWVFFGDLWISLGHVFNMKKQVNDQLPLMSF